VQKRLVRVWRVFWLGGVVVGVVVVVVVVVSAGRSPEVRDGAK